METFVLNLNEFAYLLGLTAETVKKAIKDGKFDPRDLESVFIYWLERTRSKDFRRPVHLEGSRHGVDGYDDSAYLELGEAFRAHLMESRKRSHERRVKAAAKRKGKRVHTPSTRQAVSYETLDTEALQAAIDRFSATILKVFPLERVEGTHYMRGRALSPAQREQRIKAARASAEARRKH